jgi:hypothetical protein
MEKDQGGGGCMRGYMSDGDISTYDERCECM